MRAPPPVSVELDDEPAWRWAQALVWAGALLSVAAWAAAHRELASWWLVPALGGGLAVTLGMVWRLGPARPVRLTFDGATWSCEPDRAAGGPRRCSVRVALDLGVWMLLRIDIAPVAGEEGRNAAFEGRRARRWRAVSPRLAGTGWQALRVALYCAEQGHGGRAGSGRPDE